MTRLAIAALLVACSSRDPAHAVAAAPAVAAAAPAPAPVPDAMPAPGPIEHVEACPGARATWRGEREDGNDRYSTLTVVADGKAAPIVIDVENIPRDGWSFDIFSPDCRHVMLLMSRTGPFHIVRVDRLARYAAGAPPDFELSGKYDPETETGAGNLRGGAWLSNREVVYAWGCCDPPVVERFVLP